MPPRASLRRSSGLCSLAWPDGRGGVVVTRRSCGKPSRRLSADLASLRPWQAALLGVLEQPWTLTALAAVVVVSHRAGPLAVFLAFLLFSALSTAGVITIFVYSAHRLAEGIFGLVTN